MQSTSAPGAFSSSRGKSPTLPLPPTSPHFTSHRSSHSPSTPSTSHRGCPPPPRGRYSQGDRPVGQRLGRQDLSELQVATNYLDLRRAAGRRFAGALGTPVVLTARRQRGTAAAQHGQQQQRGQEPRRAAAAARRAAESAAARGQHGGAVQDRAPLLPATDGAGGRGRREGGKEGAPVRPGLTPRGRCRRHAVPRSDGRAGAVAAAAAFVWRGSGRARRQQRRLPPGPDPAAPSAPVGPGPHCASAAVAAVPPRMRGAGWGPRPGEPGWERVWVSLSLMGTACGFWCTAQPWGTVTLREPCPPRQSALVFLSSASMTWLLSSGS